MCTTFIAKVIIGIVNFVLFIAGMAMFVIGLLINTQPAFSKTALSSVLSGLETASKQADITLVTSNFSAASIAYSFSVPLIIFGIVLATVSVIGFIGVCCGFKCVLVVYFILTLILFLAQLVLVLIAVINRNVFDDAVKPRLKQTITENYSGMNSSDANTLIWNGVMIKLECCGVDNYVDFYSSSKWPRGLSGTSNFITPLACCKTINTNYTCAVAPTPVTSNYLTGCYSKLWDFILSNSYIVIGIVVGILASQLLLLILTYIIIRSFTKVGNTV